MSEFGKDDIIGQGSDKPPRVKLPHFNLHDLQRSKSESGGDPNYIQGHTDEIRQGSDKPPLQLPDWLRLPHLSRRGKIGVAAFLAAGVVSGAGSSGVSPDQGTTGQPPMIENPSAQIQEYPLLAVGADRSSLVGNGRRILDQLNSILQHPINTSLLDGEQNSVQAVRIINEKTGKPDQIQINAAPDASHLAELTILEEPTPASSVNGNGSADVAFYRMAHPEGIGSLLKSGLQYSNGGSTYSNGERTSTIYQINGADGQFWIEDYLDGVIGVGVVSKRPFSQQIPTATPSSDIKQQVDYLKGTNGVDQGIIAKLGHEVPLSNLTTPPLKVSPITSLLDRDYSVQF